MEVLVGKHLSIQGGISEQNVDIKWKCTIIYNDIHITDSLFINVTETHKYTGTDSIIKSATAW